MDVMQRLRLYNIVFFVVQSAFLSGMNNICDPSDTTGQKKDYYPYSTPTRIGLSINHIGDFQSRDNDDNSSPIWNKRIVEKLISFNYTLLDHDFCGENYECQFFCSLRKKFEENNIVRKIIKSCNVIDAIDETMQLYNEKYRDYDIAPSHFDFIIQGKRRKTDTTYISIASISGDIETLYNLIKDYVDDDLTINNNYRNKNNKDPHFILLGDVIRGKSNLLILLLVLALKRKNPDFITYIRGYSEVDPFLNYQSEFMPELMHLYYEKEDADNIYAKIHQFFTCLPVALFLHDNTSTLYLNGIVDESYDPSILFEKLDTLDEGENYYDNFTCTIRSKFISGELVPNKDDYPLLYYYDSKRRYQESLTKDESNFETIKEYAKKYCISHIIFGAQWHQRYKGYAAMQSSNYNISVFHFDHINKDNKNNSIWFINQGPCHNSPRAFPDEKDKTGFSSTSVIEFYKNDLYNIFDVVVLKNTIKNNKFDDKSIQLFATAYAYQLEYHFQESDFPTQSINLFKYSGENYFNLSMKNKIFNYLIALFEKYQEEGLANGRNGQTKYLKGITNQELKDFLVRYATIDKNFVAMRYYSNGQIEFFNQDGEQIL